MNQKFDVAIMIFIMLNMITMCMEYDGQPLKYTEVWQLLNTPSMTFHSSHLSYCEVQDALFSIANEWAHFKSSVHLLIHVCVRDCICKAAFTLHWTWFELQICSKIGVASYQKPFLRNSVDKYSNPALLGSERNMVQSYRKDDWFPYFYKMELPDDQLLVRFAVTMDVARNIRH